MAEPLLTVVVCTHDRPGDVERCLEALASLEDPVEVVVVDSASVPSAAPVVDRFRGALPSLHFLYEPQPGLSRARNRGVEAAGCALVAFVDDDAAPAPDWARRVAGAFELDPRIGCVGGTCRADFGGRKRPRWLSDRLLQFAGVTRIGDEAREARSSRDWPFGANIAFRAEALVEAGGFSEALGRTGACLLSGEESALVEDVRARGWRIWLEPAAVVQHTVHAHRCVSRYYWRRLWWAGVGRARVASSSKRVGLRLLVAAPVRLALYVATGDRVHLYRTAESAGYLVERLRAAVAR